jgi:hypothetical protein
MAIIQEALLLPRIWAVLAQLKGGCARSDPHIDVMRNTAATCLECQTEAKNALAVVWKDICTACLSVAAYKDSEDSKKQSANEADLDKRRSVNRPKTRLTTGYGDDPVKVREIQLTHTHPLPLSPILHPLFCFS